MTEEIQQAVAHSKRQHQLFHECREVREELGYGQENHEQMATLLHTALHGEDPEHRGKFTPSQQRAYEAIIGAVIVLFEWVGLNSSLPRIIAVPIHLVNTFGLLGSYAILNKILEDDLRDIKLIFNKSFVLISFLFLLSGATGSITALADV